MCSNGKVWVNMYRIVHAKNQSNQHLWSGHHVDWVKACFAMSNPCCYNPWYAMQMMQPQPLVCHAKSFQAEDAAQLKAACAVCEHSLHGIASAMRWQQGLAAGLHPRRCAHSRQYCITNIIGQHSLGLHVQVQHVLIMQLLNSLSQLPRKSQLLPWSHSSYKTAL